MQPPKHILVADDDAPLRFIVCRILGKAGYRLSEASDGRQAHLMVLAANQCHRPFDLLLLDRAMSFICGGQLLTELSQLDFCSPILLMSEGMDSPTDSTAGSPCRGKITKPFTAQMLLDAVAQAILTPELH